MEKEINRHIKDFFPVRHEYCWETEGGFNELIDSVRIFNSPLNPLPANYTILDSVVIDTALPFTLNKPESQVNFYFHLRGENWRITQFVELESWHIIRRADLRNAVFYLVERPIKEEETEFYK